MKYTCTKTTAMVYKIRLGHTWADVTIEEWEEGGSFKCISDYGNYSYVWTSIGERNLREFLCNLNYEYFMGKAHPSHGSEFDSSASADEIQRAIIADRKEDSISKDLARQAMNCLNSMKDELRNVDVNEYYRMINESCLLDGLFGGDFHGFPHVTRRHPQCSGFWEVLWPCLVYVWKKELEEDHEEATV